MKFRKASLALLLAAILPVLAPSLFAQSAGTGALTGVVADPSNASIPNVKVTLNNTETNQERTVTTGQDGAYKFSLLPPGTYRLKFSAPRFRTAQFASVTVNVTETAVLNASLQLGQQAESIVVQGGAAALETSDSALGTVVSGNAIAEMPLSNRNYTQILGNSAGVASGVFSGALLGKATIDLSVNGLAIDQNNYQMDGVSINNAFGSGIAGDFGIYVGIPIPSPDAISEFKIQTSTYDASYGRKPGANVNVVTKSGTNQFHGGLFEFFRNEKLNANDFFQNRDGGGQKQILRQNQFGGTIGGPIKKDKLFFFGSYQGTRQRNGISGTTNVFLSPIPAGDRSAPGFQAQLGAAMCPQNHPGDPRYLTVFGIPGAVQIACDGSNISPVAMNILRVKLPNGNYYIPGSTNGTIQQVQYTQPSIYTGDQYIANFDYLITSKHTLAGRYLFSEDPQTVLVSGGSLPGTPTNSYYANTASSLKLTSVATPSFLNEARVSFQRYLANGYDTTPYSPQTVGITPIIPQQTQPPVMAILGSFTFGGSLEPYQGPSNQFQWADQISWSHGKHNVRAGFEYEALQWNLSFKSLLRGFLVSPSIDTFLLGLPACLDPSCFGFLGNPPGDTTGAPEGTWLSSYGTVRSGPDGIIHAYRERNASAFFQDDWKVNSRLTLNLGVRWEHDGTLADALGNLTNIWPSLLQTVPNPPTAPQTVGSTGASLVGYVVPSNFIKFYGQPPAGVTLLNTMYPSLNAIPQSFAPRFGFAWQPLRAGKLVVRGGFGMFYDRVGSDKLVHAVEQGNPYADTLDYSGATAGLYSLANPFPQRPLGFQPRWFDPVTGANSGLNAPFYESIHTPLTRQYNLGIQYQLLPRWVLEVGFVGSSSINQADYSHNGYNLAQLASPSHPINGQTTNTLANAAYRVPYLGYQPGGLYGTGFDAIANYNSLQVTLRKQLSHGLTAQVAYTWSKDLTNLSGDGQANSNDSSNTGQQYGPAVFARPQRLTVSYSYELPFGHPKGALGKLATGWTVAGNTIVQNGNPLTFTDTAGGSLYYGGPNPGIAEQGSGRGQICPGQTYSSLQTPGGIESRLGGNSGGPGYVTGFCSPPVVNPDLTPTTAAACPSCGTLFGNSGLGIMLGPGQFNWDISLNKITRFLDKQSLQFRVDFFNAFNHPQFGPPDAAVNDVGTFGVISFTTTNPRLIQLGLKYNF